MTPPATLRYRIEQRVNRWLMRVMLYRFHRAYTLGWTIYTAPRWAWRALWGTGMLRSGARQSQPSSRRGKMAGRRSTSIAGGFRRSSRGGRSTVESRGNDDAADYTPHPATA